MQHIKLCNSFKYGKDIHIQLNTKQKKIIKNCLINLR